MALVGIEIENKEGGKENGENGNVNSITHPVLSVTTDLTSGPTAAASNGQGNGERGNQKPASYESPYTVPPRSPFPHLVASSPVSAGTSALAPAPPISTSSSTSTDTPTSPSTSTSTSTSATSASTTYEPSLALLDIPGVSYALQAFLSSQMLESEAFLKNEDPRMERMYIATGFGLIQCVKGLMSWEDKDLIAGIQHTKHGNHIAAAHRKKAGFIGSTSRLAGYVVSSVSSALHHGSNHSENPTGDASVQWIRGMTDVERHAELTYAESLFEKALLGIVYSGDWLAFVKEALNMRTTISIYRQLHAYVEHADAVYTAVHSPSPSSPVQPKSKSNGKSKSTPKTKTKTLQDPSIDAHFRSGVLLGIGMCDIILSLMPGKLQTLVELFGYKGDRDRGLRVLMRVGGWEIEEGEEGDGEEKEFEPRVSAETEGVRRSICDMALLIFHLVLSSFTFEGVDVGVAERVLRWNLKRYPNGIFFLFGAGRLALTRSQPTLALGYYTQAMHAQSQYRNLMHISWWEMGIAELARWEVGKSEVWWRSMWGEASWSKAIYGYGLAVCLLEIATKSGTQEKEEREKQLEEAKMLMSKVPGLRQKIAGKSIPLEKFVARKARKFIAQSRRLALPALELAYIFQAIAHAPRRVIMERMLPEISGRRGHVEKEKVEEKEKAEKKLGQGQGQVQGGTLEGMGWVDGVGVLLGEDAASGGKVEGEGSIKEAKLRKHIEKKKYGVGYWDDFCLAMFLRGVCLRYVAYPDTDAQLDPTDDPFLSTLSTPEKAPRLTKEIAEREAEASFLAVFEHGPKIELDHHLVYHAHYELGRLYACQIPSSSSPASPTTSTPISAHPKYGQAKHQFELVLSGKHLEVGASGKKGGSKYSMENALHMRTHAAMDVLGSQGVDEESAGGGSGRKGRWGKRGRL